ncbi:MAG: hypothetical protein KDA92_08330, partial [Planctomycetales bacterium]|nr:hypothetical protein [Planctomycetales bacterium]
MWDDHQPTDAAERVLRDELLSVRRRRRHLLASQRVFALSAVTLLVVLALLATSTHLEVTTIRIAGSAIGAVVMLIIYVTMRAYANGSALARWIEAARPTIDQRLLTTVSRWERAPSQPLSYLERVVATEVAAEARKQPWRDLIRIEAISGWYAAATACLLFSAAGLAWMTLPNSSEALLAESLKETVAPPTVDLLVEPGNVDVEQGTSFVASAKFGKRVPRDVDLVVTWANGQTQRLPMSRRLEDPLFAVYLPTVMEPFTYRVEFSGDQSDDYRVGVFQYPELVQADATLKFPDYTGLESKEILDSRRVSAVEGTDLTWRFQLNKAVAKAWLESESGEEIELNVDAALDTRYETQLKLSADQKWKLHLADNDGRENRTLNEFVVRVLENRPPELKPTVARDQSVSPLEELEVAADVWDDFGVLRYGISYALAAQPLAEHLLGDPLDGKQRTSGSHLIDFEAMQAEPDQLLAYHFWAEDIGPDGNPRRTESDMYFAEVRRFEEIFREGESPAGGEQQQQQQQNAGNENSQQAEQLMEIQKQIVTATWNLWRRESSASQVSEAFTEDVGVI